MCVYTAAGVAGNLLSYAVGRSPLSVGASGAIFGLLGCWATFLAINSDFLAARGVRVGDSIWPLTLTLTHHTASPSPSPSPTLTLHPHPHLTHTHILILPPIQVSKDILKTQVFEDADEADFNRRLVIPVSEESLSSGELGASSS